MPNVEATFIGEEESSNRSQDSGILDTEQCQRSVSRLAIDSESNKGAGVLLEYQGYGGSVCRYKTSV